MRAKTGSAPRDARHALLCYDSERHSVREALQGHGWNARQVGPPGGTETEALPDSGVTVLVVGQGPEGDRALLAAERQASECKRPIVLLLDDESEAHQRWAARLTPYCYPRSLAAESLASLLDRIAETQRGRPAEADSARRVTLRVGESLEVDGELVRLGVAERNLLWELACTRDRRVGKDAPIEAGPGRRVVARECRRRLGRRLGEELASLLIPAERGEPYRLREPDDVRACCSRDPGRHPATEVRILGRSEVRLSFVEDPDRIPRR